jgi:L-threonylcarbamoyladenylate synthase
LRHAQIGGCDRQALLSGAVIAYPTEGVWGLGCSPASEQAVMRVLRMKQRSVKQGLILVAGSIDQFAPYFGGLNEDQIQQLNASWPGPVTFLVPDQGVSPDFIRGDHATVALRVSAHPVVQSLCQMLGGPMVSTSANRSGEPAALSESEVAEQFATEVDFIISGPLGGQTGPSEIIDLATGQVLRPQGAR